MTGKAKPTPETVKCRACGGVFPIGDMPRKWKTPPSGTAKNYHTICRECSKAVSKAYGAVNGHRRRARETKYYRKWQGLAIAAYGGKCECCEETEPKFLEIDHVNGGGSRQRRVEKDPEAFYRRIATARPEGFRVLCSNCNHGRYRNGGECPHKTKQLDAHALEVNPWYLQRFTQVM